MEENIDFIGKGWSFPPEFREQDKKPLMTTGIDEINNSLKILFSTSLGERVMFSAFGCDMNEFLFESIDLTLKTQLKELIKEAVALHEPRIDLLFVDVDQEDNLSGKLLIQIDYQIRNTNTRSNIVFPFYKGEATEI